MALQANWWIITAGLLLYRPFADGRDWAQMAGVAVLFMAALLVFGGLLLVQNPLFSRHAVGEWPLFNLLSLAYLAPAALLGLLAASPRVLLPRQIRSLLPAGGGILVFAYLTLEVRRFFWGDDMPVRDFAEIEFNATAETPVQRDFVNRDGAFAFVHSRVVMIGRVHMSAVMRCDLQAFDSPSFAAGEVFFLQAREQLLFLGLCFFVAPLFWENAIAHIAFEMVCWNHF